MKTQNSWLNKLIAIRYYLLAAALVFAFEAWGTWVPSPWQDELATIAVIKRDLWSIVVLTQTVDAVHVTYYLFVKLWATVFGFSPFAVRLFSAFVVSLTSLAVFKLGKKLDSKLTGWFAAALFVVLPRTTWAAGEARSPALSMLAATLAILAFVNAVQSGSALVGKKLAKPWRWFVAAAAFAIYVHMYELLLVGALLAVMWFGKYRGMQIKAAIRSVMLALLSALPVVVYSAIQSKQVSWLPETKLVEVPNSIFWYPIFGLDLVWPWVCLAAVALSLIAWIFKQGGFAKGNQLLLWISLWAFTVPNLVILGYSVFIKTMYEPRYLAFLTPVVALFIGYLIAKLPAQKLLIMALALSVAVGLGSYQYQRTELAKNNDSALVAKVVAENSKPGDAVVYADFVRVNPKTSRLAFIFESEFKNLTDLGIRHPVSNWNTIFPLRLSWAEQQKLVGSYDRVWLASLHKDDAVGEQQAIEFLQSRGYHLVQSWQLPRTYLYLYEPWPLD